MPYVLRGLSNEDGCNALSLGDAAFAGLKTFLRREAKRLHRDHLARTFVLVESGQTRVMAYITLVCTHIAVEQFEAAAPVGEFRYADFPAIKLARLAVDNKLQGQGVGGQLVDFAIALAVNQVMPHVGCRFMVVDAKLNSVGFYERKGFTRFGSNVQPDGLTTLFMDLHRLKLD